MKFPQSFFEDEVRDGFYIPSIMKCAWAAQLEVLEDIDRVCKKYQLSYFAVSGTLLGAVRHGGYIPWDDDLDICMTRPDFDRFFAVAKKELPEGYDVADVYHDAKWDEIYARVINGRTFRFDSPFLEKFHGFPYVAGVDIFPLDYIVSDEEELDLLASLLEPIIMCIYTIDSEYMDQDAMEEQLFQIEELCNVKFDRSKPIKNELIRLGARLYSIYREQESDLIGMTPEWLKKPKMRWPKEYFKRNVLLPFEGMGISVPVGYDEVLRGIFGEYMRISYDGGLHDYPFYRSYEKILYEQGNPFPNRYRFHIEEFAEKGHEVAETLMKIKNRALKTGLKKNVECREIVFLPYKSSTWDALESVWKAASADPDCNVYVIPVPYFDKNWDGSVGEMHYEGSAFPDYVPITRYDQYDFETHHPDRIYIQFPHDEYHYTTSVAPSFFAKKLVNYTDSLIYIPYFVVDEIESWNEKALENAKSFINVPAVFYADQVIVQSENMRQVYIDTLSEFAGEETRKIWEDKILGIGSPKTDRDPAEQKAAFPIPAEWRERMEKPDGSIKKVILYHNSVSTLVQYQELMLEKIQDTFRIFQERQEDVVLLWRPNPLIQVSLSQTYPGLWRAYQEIVDRFKEENLGIYDDTTDFRLAATICDAYYGDADPEMNLCRRQGKPVMWQNVSIMNSIKEY